MTTNEHYAANLIATYATSGGAKESECGPYMTIKYAAGAIEALEVTMDGSRDALQQMLVEILDRADAYADGRADADYPDPNSLMTRRLRDDVDYWQGYHDARPDVVRLSGKRLLVDPTRPAGWCAAPA